MSLGKISNAAAASVTTGNGTFSLVAGQKLNILVNGPNVAISATNSPIYGGDLTEYVVVAKDFASISAATATELAAALNAAFVAQAAAGQPASTVAAVSGSAVKISTSRTGVNATLQILPSSTAALLTTLTLTAGVVTLGTGVKGVGAQPSAPLFVDFITFTGDSAYSSGGTAAFTAFVRAFFGDNRTVVGVISQDCGGYFPVYVPTTDKLKVFEAAAQNASQVPGAEYNGSDLSAVTFNMLVLSY